MGDSRTQAYNEAQEASQAAFRAIARRDRHRRMCEELRELRERLTKLVAFISSSASFHALPEDEQGLLRIQREAMVEYEHALSLRVALLQEQMGI